jgi:ketosteroid isomerase-like protein
MKFIHLKTLVGILVTALCLAAATGPKADQEVLAAMDAFKDALIHRDGAALGRLLSDDLAYTHSAGQFQTKAELIESITSGKSIIERIDYSNTTVRFYGNTALVRGNVDLYHSKTNIVHMNVLHVWVKSPQGWQLVARQATRLATPVDTRQSPVTNPTPPH